MRHGGVEKRDARAARTSKQMPSGLQQYKKGACRFSSPTRYIYSLDQ